MSARRWGSRMDNGRDTYSRDFESILPDHPVRLANFEGPLDLLLHLIKKNEVSIYDIPIALITEQYLEYLDLMQELDLDVAGEFLIMAATLIHIKSKMLVPRIETEDDAHEEEEAHDALVLRLLEHQKYRSAAELLHERETVRSAQWTRPNERIEDIAGVPFERELEVDMFSLLQAFQAVLARSHARRRLVLPAEVVSIETRIEQLLERLSKTEACGFEDLFLDASSRADLVTSFLALLEMIRLKLIRVYQADLFGPIRVYKRAQPVDAPMPINGPIGERRG